MHISELPLDSVIELTEDFEQVQYQFFEKIPANVPVYHEHQPRGTSTRYADCLFAYKRANYPVVESVDRFFLRRSGGNETKVILGTDDFSFDFVC